MRLNIIYINKTLSTVIILVIILFFNSSCEKVIDIDLNSKSPQIVIEANITDEPNSCIVTINQTVNYDESNNFPEVTGAKVKISDGLGNSELLTETSLGVYKTLNFQGTKGRTYTLTVSFNEKEYLATSYMPAPVSVDTLTIVTLQTPKEKSKTIYVNFTDPVGISNYYRFIKIINGTAQSSIFITDDLLKDGYIINQPLLSRGQDEVKIKSGDRLSVVCQSIDKNVYNYFRSLLQLSSGGMINQSSSPANPLSNFNNGALGYFNACAVTSKTIVIH